MEHKEYYTKRPNGTFLVHFPNFHKLTEEEIRERFAQYGKVLSVDTRGQVSGLCFVLYESEEDVIRCLEGFRHQKDIRILKHKSQLKTKDVKPLKQMQQADAEGSVKGNNSNVKPKMFNTMTEGHTDFEKGETSNSQRDNERSDLMRKGRSDEQGSIKSYPKFSQGTSKPIFKSEKKVIEPKVEHHSPGSVKSESKFKKKVPNHKMKQLSAGSIKPNTNMKKKELNHKTETGIPPLMAVDLGLKFKLNAENEQCSVSYTDSKANSIVDDHTSLNDFDSLTDQQSVMHHLRMQGIRSLASSTTSSMKSVPTITGECKTDSNTRLAQEVIVANIDDTYGIHYILHLFEKFNPIAASMMKTTLRAKIRYCHIYFTHWKEALSTQQEFDNYSLEGKKLVVLASQNLTREALAA